MSAWTIYWILQLDSIGFFLAMLFFGGLCVSGLSLFIGAMATDRGCLPSQKQDERWEVIRHRARRVSMAALIVGGVGALLPTTKTAAAMVILPAIANNEVIRDEAGEIYGLAKQALRDAITDAAKPDEPEKSE